MDFEDGNGFNGDAAVKAADQLPIHDHVVQRDACLNCEMQIRIFCKAACIERPNRVYAYGQVLVVSRVGQPQDRTGCVTAYVDALENKDANELARKLADEQAPIFPCGKEKPVFHGKVGSKVSEPQYVYPDLSEAN